MDHLHPQPGDQLPEESAVLLASIVNHASEAIIVIDEQQRILLFNAAAEELFGYRAGQVLGQSMDLLMPERYRVAHHHHIETFRAAPDTARTMGRRSLEITAQKRDGTEFPAEVGISKLPWNGRTIAIAILNDVSERKRAEALLRERDERFHALVENSADAISLIDGTGVVLYSSPSYQQLMGFTREERQGKNTLELVHADDRALVQRLLGGILRAPGRIALPPIRVRHKDGSWRWIEGVANNLLAEPSIRAIVVNFRDITESRNRQRELEAVAAVSAALRAAAGRAEMLPIILDEVRSLLEAGGAALAARDSATDRVVIELGHGDWSEATGARLPSGANISQHVMESGQSYVTDDVYTSADAVRVDLHAGLAAAACVPLIAEEQTIGALWVGRGQRFSPDELRVLTAIADIAANALHRASIVETLEQRVADRTRALTEANRRLQELDRLKDQFVSDVSHELRTPQTNIALYINLLERGSPEKRGEYLATLRRESARLGTMIDDLLDLSRLERGVMPVQLVATDLHELLHWLVADRAAWAAQCGLTLNYQPAAVLPSALADPALLTRVASNLLTNAIRYTPGGGAVVVTTGIATDGEQPTVWFSIRDTGPGIGAHELPHLFQRFYRGEAARKSAAPGTGLGLAICKEIVERLNGRITVESQIGHGASFTVRLPMAETD